MIRLYVIIRADGEVKKGKGGQFAVYKQYARACHWAQGEGDSVVAVDIDLTKEPLYINGRTV